MSRLVCLGLGYSASHLIAAHGGRFRQIAGTTTRADKARGIARDGISGHPVAMHVHNGGAPSLELAADLAQATHVLVSAGPTETGDPFLPDLEAAVGRDLQSLVYLSTVGVYGDHDGAWIDESAECRPSAQRTRARLKAEALWTELGAARGVPVAILRLAGIYGPGQNALLNVAAGTAKRIVRPGQVFNRIHVADIATTVLAAFDRQATGLFNVADDEPCPGDEVVAFAASLLGRAPPPLVAYADIEAILSPMAKSFYGEVKRIRNDRIKRELGVALRYPTYREALTALHAAGEGVS
jgi:NAD dependent epimerase/dehydratase family